MPADPPTIRHSEARFLRDVHAGKVSTDTEGRIWRADRASHTGRRHAETPTRTAEQTGWVREGTDGVYELTGHGEQALAAYDRAQAKVSRVAPVVTRTVTRRGQVA